MTAVLRLQREHQQSLGDPAPGCAATPTDDSVFVWKGYVVGPPGTPYEDGFFSLKMLFCENYPFMPPTVRFTTKVYHCNIWENGAICLDILGEAWAPSMSMSALLTSIRSLLPDPNPTNAISPLIAKVWLRDRAEHHRVARQWAHRLANAPRHRNTS